MTIGGTLLEIIDSLLSEADPEGENAERLRRYRQFVLDGVMLGAGARAFLARMVEECDNVECAHLSHVGNCGVRRGAPCASQADFQACADYQRPRAHNGRGRSPLAPIGGTHA